MPFSPIPFRTDNAMDANSLNGLATQHYRTGNLRMAVNALTTALRIDPDHVDSHLNVASLLLEAGQVELAQMHAERALALAPRRYESVLGIGLIHRVRERSGEAIDWLVQAERISPRRVEAPMALGTTHQEMGMPVEAIAAFDRALAWHPSNPELLSNRLFTTNFLPTFDPQVSRAMHRDYERRIRIPKAAAVAAGATSGVRDNNGVRDKNGTDASRLRIGYVSGDLRLHAVARFLMPVLRERDRDRFHVTGYYTGRIIDAVTREIAALCDGFRHVAALSDAALLAQVAADGIDVLVDCSGHSAGNRLPVFAARAASAQVSWLGYLGSTGLSTIDARLTDPHADPHGVSEAFHVEPLIRLPETMWAYEPYPDAPDPRATRRTDDAIVFGVLSNPSKLSDAALDAWAQILSAIPSSRLMMTAREDSALRARILGLFTARSVDPSRVELLSRMSTHDYLDAYASIDIVLDTFPVSGGTTVCDALWQGVPVLAVKSARPYGGTSASVLHQVGMDDWVCDSASSLVERAVMQARLLTAERSRDRANAGVSANESGNEIEVASRNEIEQRIARRRALRARMRTSPLLGASRVARAVESSFVAVRERVDKLRIAILTAPWSLSLSEFAECVQTMGGVAV